MRNSAASPIRYPDLGSQKSMTIRAFLLIVVNFLIPGSAQTVAGNRKLGRCGLFFTLLLWVLLLVAIAVVVFDRTVLITIFTAPIALIVVQVFLAFYALLWLILSIDTVRLVRLIRTHPAARLTVAVLTTAVLVALTGTAGYASYLIGIQRGAIETIFSAKAEVVPPVNGRYNILLLGGDAGPDRTGMRPDSISVLSVEAETGKATMIGIPRNLQNAPFAEGSPLFTQWPEGAYDCGDDCLISYLYPRVEESHPDLYPNAVAQGSSPGVEATKDSVEGALGITIQYYVLIDMQGFSDLIDALGGITVDVKERQPIGGDEQLNQVEDWIEPGIQKMDGHTALWYARSRHASNDYDRMDRQRQIQEAVLAQFDPTTVLSKFQAIAAAGAQVVKTDIPRSMLGYFVSLGLKTKSIPITKLQLVPPLVDTSDPDFAAIRQSVSDALILSTSTPNPEPQ